MHAVRSIYGSYMSSSYWIHFKVHWQSWTLLTFDLSHLWYDVTAGWRRRRREGLIQKFSVGVFTRYGGIGWLVDPSAALSRAGCGLKTRGGVGWGKFTPRSIDVTTPANENNGSIVWL